MRNSMALCGVVLFAAPALAGELSKEGKYSGQYYSSGTSVIAMLGKGEVVEKLFEDPFEDGHVARMCRGAAHVRLRGGASRSLAVTRSCIAPKKRTPPDVVARIDQLLELGDDGIVADQLNVAGVRNWRNRVFTKSQISAIRIGYKLRSHGQRRRTAGYGTAGGLAARYDVTRTTIRHWAQNGLLERMSCGKRHRWYYRLPVGTAIVKGYGGRYARQPRIVPTSTCNSSQHGAV